MYYICPVKGRSPTRTTHVQAYTLTLITKNKQVSVSCRRKQILLKPIISNYY